LLLLTILPARGVAAEDAAVSGESATQGDDARLDIDPERNPVALKPAQSHLIAAREVAGIDLAIWAVDAYVFSYWWAKVDAHSIWSNATAAFSYDDDDFINNVFLHSYHGNLSYAAARSCGLPFWTSSLYTFGGSLAWEIVFETKPPSTNDMIVTVVAGSLLGEALFRLSRLALSGEDRSEAGRRVASVLLSPMTGLNDLLFGERFRVAPQPSSPWNGRLAAGGTGGAFSGTGGYGNLPLQAYLGGSFAYGLPGETEPRRPFNLFDLSLDFISGLDAPWERLADPRGPAWALQLRGLLLGAEAGEAAGARLLWGLFGAFDYAGPTRLRAAACAVGPGFTSVLRPPGGVNVEATLLLAPAFGSGGAPVPLVHRRDYAYAYGALVVADLRARLRERLEFRTALHAYLYPAVIGGGAEATLLATGSTLVRLSGPHALVLNGMYVARWARLPESSCRQRTVYYGLAYALELGGGKR
jgi:hypothetical protein